ncbi:PepSY domain-containing protein [Pseudonocardia nematodicida]|uniref:PepSY domain-containing protein n=1 Tax=Pseudonocardia nematodicida TaxID=1206997 RepID=A0ABV1KI20_9PSEU
MHRWLAIVVSAALLVEFTSGLLLLFRPEIVGDGPDGLFWGLLLNLHDCGLSCPELPGHLPLLAAAVPGLPTTWGRLGLGMLGLALLVLCLSGMTAWWSSVRDVGRSLRAVVRPKLDRGAFRAHRDLHLLAALVALPLLLVWATTGAANGFAGGVPTPGAGGIGLHSGAFLPWWARTVWPVAGLAALYLVGSGLWTWWWRSRRTRTPATAVRNSGADDAELAPSVPRQRTGTSAPSGEAGSTGPAASDGVGSTIPAPSGGAGPAEPVPACVSGADVRGGPEVDPVAVVPAPRDLDAPTVHLELPIARHLLSAPTRRGPGHQPRTLTGCGHAHPSARAWPEPVSECCPARDRGRVRRPGARGR